jgi:RNA methyltransferase, TrmH family
MKENGQQITSLQNPRVKEVVKLSKRSYRDEKGILLVEGYRELKRALDNRWKPAAVFFCPELFLGKNEMPLVELCESAGAEVFECSTAVFEKMAYRDRPEGLLAEGPQIRSTIADLRLKSTAPFFVVAESVEKPGNLGTILRSADAAGVDAVIVCDERTDINNPNVVRASIGTLFSLPVVTATSDETMKWLKGNNVQIIAASPHATAEYTEIDLTRGVAFVVGSEQYGLSDAWMKNADIQVQIPMLGQADSLNVSAATTILLYEVVRQRRSARK